MEQASASGQACGLALDGRMARLGDSTSLSWRGSTTRGEMECGQRLKERLRRAKYTLTALTNVPTLSGTELELKAMFESVRKDTNNFTILPAELLSKSPEKIKVFRMLLGKGLREMGELVSRSFVTVSNYELGKIKTIPISESEKMSEIILKNLPSPVTEETLIRNQKFYHDRSKGGVLQALKRAETMALTRQESIVMAVLEDQRIQFEYHVTLDTKIGPLNFDFLVKKNVVIDCTTTTNKWKAESLGFRSIKVKEAHPNFKTIAIIPASVNQGFLRRLVDFDHVLKDDEITTLTALV